MKYVSAAKDIELLYGETHMEIIKLKPGDTIPLGLGYFLVETCSDNAAKTVNYVLTQEDIDAAQQQVDMALLRGDITEADLV